MSARRPIRRRVLVAAVLLAIAAGAVGWWWWWRARVGLMVGLIQVDRDRAVLLVRRKDDDAP